MQPEIGAPVATSMQRPIRRTGARTPFSVASMVLRSDPLAFAGRTAVSPARGAVPSISVALVGDVSGVAVPVGIGLPRHANQAMARRSEAAIRTFFIGAV
jgi:hypothetical protein